MSGRAPSDWPPARPAAERPGPSPSGAMVQHAGHFPADAEARAAARSPARAGVPGEQPGQLRRAHGPTANPAGPLPASRRASAGRVDGGHSACGHHGDRPNDDPRPGRDGRVAGRGCPPAMAGCSGAGHRRAPGRHSGRHSGGPADGRHTGVAAGASRSGAVDSPPDRTSHAYAGHPSSPSGSRRGSHPGRAAGRPAPGSNPSSDPTHRRNSPSPPTSQCRDPSPTTGRSGRRNPRSTASGSRQPDQSTVDSGSPCHRPPCPGTGRPTYSRACSPRRPPRACSRRYRRSGCCRPDCWPGSGPGRPAARSPLPRDRRASPRRTRCPRPPRSTGPGSAASGPGCSARRPAPCRESRRRSACRPRSPPGRPCPAARWRSAESSRPAARHQLHPFQAHRRADRIFPTGRVPPRRPRGRRRDPPRPRGLTGSASGTSARPAPRSTAGWAPRGTGRCWYW